MSSSADVRVGVIGLGFMGQTHARAYAHAPGCRLTAVCDSRPERLTGETSTPGNMPGSKAFDRLFDPEQLIAYRDLDAMLADPQLDLVSVCTPTDTHTEIAERALRAGKHVLVEKPVSLHRDEIESLAAARTETGLLCRPAMCMRYWPGWTWLKGAIESNEFGAPRTVSFQRLGGRPAWGDGFYDNDQRTGGALVDLHIHDADLVLWLLGPPDAVLSRGGIDHVATQYLYDEGPPMVRAEGGWLPGGAVPFRMRFIATFDDATAEFDSARAQPLHLTTRGATETVSLPLGDGYEAQATSIVRAVATGDDATAPTLEDAHRVTRLLDAERESLTNRALVSV